jgi:ABC-type phosphate/phosphonate transport system ATPase subunit
MIELLGAGVPRREGGWLLHRVCATLESGELTLVLSAAPDERGALLDAITGRRIPDEGRIWVSRVPLMRTSQTRIRALCGEIDVRAGLIERRSLFWNILAPSSGPRTLGRLLRLPRRHERQAAMAALERVGLRGRADEAVAALAPFDRARFLVARALARRPRYLVVREPDTLIDPHAVGAFLALLRLIAHQERVGIVVSLAEGGTVTSLGDRVLVLGDGVLLFHDRVEALNDERAAWRAGTVTR